MTTHYEYNRTSSQARVITIKSVNPKLTSLLHDAAQELRMDDNVSYDGKGSRYEAPNGCRCIIGHALGHAKYNDDIEGLAAASPTVASIIGEHLNTHLTIEDLAFLSIVQHVHDRSVVEAVDTGKRVDNKRAFDAIFPRNLVKFDTEFFELFLDADLYVVDDTEPMRDALTRLASHYRYNAVR